MTKKRFSLLNLALVLLALIAAGIFILPKMEDKVLGAEQAAIVKHLTYQFKSGTDTVNVTDATLGKAVAILEIPKIKLTVPVYYGTDDAILSKAVGVVEGTSDIDGGKGKNPVLSAHRGLSQNKLFTNLPELKKKDRFTIITESGKRLYQVDKISEVKAEKLDEAPEKYLASTADKDYVTLVTCTPLYINSHRLLVRAHRVYN